MASAFQYLQSKSINSRTTISVWMPVLPLCPLTFAVRRFPRTATFLPLRSKSRMSLAFRPRATTGCHCVSMTGSPPALRYISFVTIAVKTLAPSGPDVSIWMSRPIWPTICTWLFMLYMVLVLVCPITAKMRA